MEHRMYIDKLHLKNIRTFVDGTLEFIHPETAFRDPAASDDENAGRLPGPLLPNVNLLLGENGAGKTTVLQAIALASLGPVAPIAHLPVPRLVRMSSDARVRETAADVRSHFLMHSQDANPAGEYDLHLMFLRRDETEEMRLGGYFPSDFPDDASKAILARQQQTITSASRDILHLLSLTSEEPPELFSASEGTARAFSKLDNFIATAELLRHKTVDARERVHNSQNPSYFCVAYGATRRSDPGDARLPSMHSAGTFLRRTRLQSIFEDGFRLYPLRYWLPALKSENPDRHTEILTILNSLISDEHSHLTSESRDGEPLFERHGMKLPLSALSDGYRAFIAWVADLLYHLSCACPGEQSLLDCRGIVLVDQIDLHLHPRWQLKVISTIANAFPKMQFIFTSHSPLIVGSVEWMNILTLQTDPATNETDIKRWPESVHGLDADQILLTKFFGLTTTRAGAKVAELAALREAALAGDRRAARELLFAMSTGTEYQP
ncbi:MAG: AAA family ATPase [Planctomycetaceae bacterium]